jgi:hypothetical protein
MMKELSLAEAEVSQQLKDLKVEESLSGAKKKRRKKKKNSTEGHKARSEQLPEVQEKPVDQPSRVEKSEVQLSAERLLRQIGGGEASKLKHTSDHVSKQEFSSNPVEVTRGTSIDENVKEKTVRKPDSAKPTQPRNSSGYENQIQSGNNNNKNNRNSSRERDFFVECPHCQGLVQILAIKCGIFRHGVFKSTGRQLNPHETKERCESFVARGVVEGCGKPFMISKTDRSVAVCDYI